MIKNEEIFFVEYTFDYFGSNILNRVIMVIAITNIKMRSLNLIKWSLSLMRETLLR